MQEGTKAMETYYNPEDLDKFSTMGEEAPELWDLYMAYYGKVFAEGALTAREKALIALAVAGAVQCPYCIDSYTQSCLEKGVTEEQMPRNVDKPCTAQDPCTDNSPVQTDDETYEIVQE